MLRRGRASRARVSGTRDFGPLRSLGALSGFSVRDTLSILIDLYTREYIFRNVTFFGLYFQIPCD